ncbi:hypothetical protein OL239_07750 [Arthrobacter sp. ATA002]|uniref:hypothetical protein n=1 Tax=Arthrobacter sp. ATA002 TaxID=2991715 RepID=UPI0022A7FA0C|nr:hypothetical protein [Arthrobacter sp. ATA002]WAP52994.1 hypothetical protein OL239_07750 [Arthrobacter sp. ATA002]
MPDPEPDIRGASVRRPAAAGPAAAVVRRGAVRGLVVVPGVVAGLEWAADGTGAAKLVRAELQARSARSAGTYQLEWNGVRRLAHIGAGEATVVSAADFTGADPLCPAHPSAAP